MREKRGLRHAGARAHTHLEKEEPHVGNNEGAIALFDPPAARATPWLLCVSRGIQFKAHTPLGPKGD